MTGATRISRKCPGLCPAASLLAAAILFSTLFILQSLPPTSSSARHRPLLNGGFSTIATTEPHLGRYGELMLSFLRADLPFTLFIPTPSAFERMLLSMNSGSNTSGVLSANNSVSESVFAVVTRIFGFSAVPLRILSGTVALSCEMGFDSVSGFRLNVMRLPPKDTLMVNNLACTAVDIIKGSIVIHLVDGILMDIDFEQSVMPYQDTADEDLAMELQY